MEKGQRNKSNRSRGASSRSHRLRRASWWRRRASHAANVTTDAPHTTVSSRDTELVEEQQSSARVSTDGKSQGANKHVQTRVARTSPPNDSQRADTQAAARGEGAANAVTTAPASPPPKAQVQDRRRRRRRHGPRHATAPGRSAPVPSSTPEAAGTTRAGGEAGASPAAPQPHVQMSTLRMNPYVRCVQGNGILDIKSLKELLLLPNYAEAAEADTPCLRPCGAPAVTFDGSPASDDDGGSFSSSTKCVPPGQEEGTARPLTSQQLAFTMDSVATPNTFATVATHEESILTRLHTGRFPSGEPMHSFLSEHDAMAGHMRLPSATGDTAVHPCGRAHPPLADCSETQADERIVSPHSADHFQRHASPADGLAEGGDLGAAFTAAHDALPQQQPLMGHRLLIRPVNAPRVEESPYHYIMRNYVGGTFLYYSSAESKEYFLGLCYRVVEQVRQVLEQETISPHYGLFPPINAPVFVLGDVHGNFEDLSFFLRHILTFHDLHLTPANLLCLGDYVDRGPHSLECVLLLFSLKLMNAGKIVLLRGNHEDRVVCGDLSTYGRGSFLAQCQSIFGYKEGVRLFKEVTALFRYLPLAAELVIPNTPNTAYLEDRHRGHPNLEINPLAVPIHPARSASLPPKTSTSDPGGASAGAAATAAAEGEVAAAPLTAHAIGFDTATLRDTFGTIAEAFPVVGQPSRLEAHEERIFCTHGGIPRFCQPPREDGSLEFLRSIHFPRMLTLFPNNTVAQDDRECAPDFFATNILGKLWRQYPHLAPAAFNEEERRLQSQQGGDAGLPEAAALQSHRMPSPGVTGAQALAGHDVGGHHPTPRVNSALPELTEEALFKAWYVMFDLMWSDPTPMEQDGEDCSGDGSLFGAWGFASNSRGGSVVSFSKKAVETFLSAYNYSMLFRAHQEKAHGLRWSKSSKVLTIFSSSNYLGHRNGAGCVVVANTGEVQMIEKICSPC